MRRKVFFAWGILVLLFVMTALGQQQAPTSPRRTVAQNQPAQSGAAQTPSDWRVNWRNATVAFGQVKHESLSNRDFFSAVGTGVLISTGEHIAHVVTAKHVFCEPDQKWYPKELNMRFAWQDHKSIYNFTGIPFALRDDKGTPLWVALDDGSDIAALPVPLDFNDRLPAEDRKERYDVIGMQSIDSDVFEGEQLLVFGFPAVAGNDYLARAIVRQGIVAWTNPTHPADSVFLIDANLYPGNSGGPVVGMPFGQMKDGKFNYITGGQISLLGIVSEGIAQDVTSSVSGPRIGRIESHTKIAGVGAIGIIEPASKVSRLLTLVQQGAAKTPVCETG